MRFYTMFLVICLPVVLSSGTFAQIPNGGFEQWTSGTPLHWLTDNTAPYFPITQSADAHSGSSALRGEVIDIGMGLKLMPLLQAGDSGNGIAVNQRYASLQGYYKFSPVGGDGIVIYVILMKNNTAVASGGFTDTTTESSYRQISVPLAYITGDVPDTAIIQVHIVGPTGIDYHVGTHYLLDDLSFSGMVNDVKSQSEEPLGFALAQNNPNPFNPTTQICYDLSKTSKVSLKVIDVLGKEVATLINEVQPAGYKFVNWNAEGIASGVYFYRLEAVDVADPMKVFVQMKKMILLK